MWLILVVLFLLPFVYGQGANLIGTGYVGSAAQGVSTSLSGDGNTLAVGGFQDSAGVGAVWIYSFNGSVWDQQGEKLVGIGNIGQSNQGISVSLSFDGNTLALGANGDNSNIGATWVFTRSNGGWIQQGNKLIGTGYDGAATQGDSVSLSSDGNTLAVGGSGDGFNIGATWVFIRSGGVWTQQDFKIRGTGYIRTPKQGGFVALSSDGNTLVVGGSNDNNNKGATWVFIRSEGLWPQQGSKLVGTGGVGSLQQGSSISLSTSANTIAISGSIDASQIENIWIFTRTAAGIWSQQGEKIVETANVGGGLLEGFFVSSNRLNVAQKSFFKLNAVTFLK